MSPRANGPEQRVKRVWMITSTFTGCSCGPRTVVGNTKRRLKSRASQIGSVSSWDSRAGLHTSSGEFGHSLSTTLSRKREADGDRSVTRLVTGGSEVLHDGPPDHSGAGDVLPRREGRADDRSRACPDHDTDAHNGIEPERLRQALLDAARQHIIIVEAPTTVCRMPILPSDAIDRRFILKPAPGSPQPKMPSVGKLLPCPWPRASARPRQHTERGPHVHESV